MTQHVTRRSAQNRTFAMSPRSDEKIMLEIQRAQRELDRFEDRLTSAIEAGKFGRAKYIARLMMRSYHCRLASLYRANNKIKRQWRRLQIQQLPDAASRMDLWNASDEPVLLLDKPKRNGGTREVSEFGPLNRAAHTLLKTILEPVIKPQLLPSQHLLNGGRDKCATATINRIENGGHKWACEMDIKNFYPSINIEWLKSELLPIVNPGSLERNIDASKLNYLKLNASHNSNAGASRFTSRIATRVRARERRMGLSQGSPLSSLLGEFVVSRVLSATLGGAVVECFVDNLQISTKTKKELEDRMLVLRRSFDQHPSGTLALYHSKPRRVCNGFEMLGYEVTKGKHRTTTSVHVNNRNRWRLIENLCGFHRAHVALSEDVFLKKLQERCASWQNSFRLAYEVDVFMEFTILPFAAFLARNPDLASRDAAAIWRSFNCARSWRLRRARRFAGAPVGNVLV
ncbi:MAG: reverse transcriptase domain-containing protein [Methylocella sp.]